MKAVLVAVGVVAVVLIVLGLLLKALKWLIILGAVALVASIIMGILHGRRAAAP